MTVGELQMYSTLQAVEPSINELVEEVKPSNDSFLEAIGKKAWGALSGVTK